LNGDFAHGLHSVGVHRDVVPPGQGGYFLYGLDDPCFVVGVHDRNQDGAFADRVFDGRGFHPAGGIDRNVGNLRSRALEDPARFQNRRVFDFCRDNVVSWPVPASENAPESGVVALRSAGSENNFLRVGTQKIRDRTARVLDGAPRFLSEDVDGTGVAEILPEKGDHGFKYDGVHLGRCTVVEVDSLFHSCVKIK